MNGCKYPGTPEPCEGYREVMEVLAEAEEALLKIADIETVWDFAEFSTPIASIRTEARQALTRINRLKDIDHHRKEVEKMLEPAPDRQLTTKEALANVDMEKVGLEASIEQLNVILEAKDMLLADAANGLRDALGAFENNNAIDWDELEQTLSAIKQALGIVSKRRYLR
jgi:predicted sulfurtransferase